ncbi:MAG: type III pantothenate kinase [Phycisphaerales bacterium JB037]
MPDPTESSPPPIVAVAVGNSRTRFGRFEGASLHHPHSIDNADPARVAADLVSAGGDDAIVVIASVNAPVADAIEDHLAKRGHADRLYRVGRDLPIPVRHTLDDPTTVGVDRLVTALGAYSKAQQACVVVDAGTAVTVDFVDGEGVFHGGAILPGARMMLQALHEHTSALPEVALGMEKLDLPTFGKDTPGAMRLGVASAVVGAVHRLVQRYAEFFGGYPQIVATGGDAPLLFEHDEIVEHIVPDLQLMGIHAVCAHALLPADDE